MRRLLSINPVTAVWMLLAALTGLSWWLGSGQGSGEVQDFRYTTVGLLALAFFKVRLVILYFMEIRTAPWSLRLVFEAWVVVVALTVISIYWIGAASP